MTAAPERTQPTVRPAARPAGDWRPVHYWTALLLSLAAVGALVALVLIDPQSELFPPPANPAWP